MSDHKPDCDSLDILRNPDGIAKPCNCGASLATVCVRLDFMVVPELLATLAYVPDAVRCRIVDAEAIFLTGILGESGRKLVSAGIEFYFTRLLAEKLIAKGIAVAAMKTRPTVDQLEKILINPEPLDIQVQPDGSIRAVPKSI